MSPLNLADRFNQAPRCGAHTRSGAGCLQPSMANGRCRLHGGHSTGPRTPEGRERIRAARTVHGGYNADNRRLAELIRELKARSKALVALT